MLIKLIQFLKIHSLSAGILLMFSLTWPIDLANAGLLPFQIPFAMYIFLGWGFILAAVIMTGATLGKDALISLLKRYLLWRLNWKWYLAALCLVPALWIAGVAVYAVLTGEPVDFGAVMAKTIFGSSTQLPAFILPWFLYEVITNGEEIGWRGYVLPRLQTKYAALTSALITGMVWGVWHLPKFLSHFDWVSFSWFILHTLAISVLLTWLYNSTEGSLLIVVLCHAASNTAGMFLPVANTTTNENMGAFITIVLLELALAALITAVAGPEHLSRAGRINRMESSLSV